MVGAIEGQQPDSSPRACKQKGVKRDHTAVDESDDVDAKQSTGEQSVTDGDVGMTESAKPEEGEVATDAEEERVKEPSPKLPRLAEDVLKKPAAVGSNQVIVNALFDYAEEQLQQGHTGKGVTHLRAARALRDHSSAITTGTEARDVPLVGTKLAAEVEQILESGKVEDTTEVGNPDEDKPTEPRLVRELRASTAKCAENQPVVDKLLRYGEHQLHARNGSKGTSYLRAARKLQLTDHVIASGAQAREEVALVGPVIADAIDQILEHKCIGKGATCSAKTIETDTSEKDRDENSAVRPENQFIVDALVDYGDRCFQLSQWEEGVTHLRAAKAIRDADVTVTTGKQAAEELNECSVVDKIDSIIDGHDNAVEEDEVVDDDDGAVGRTSSVERVGEKYDQDEASSDSSISEEEEQETALAVAATRLQDAAELVADSSVVKALGCIGEKVATFISTGVALHSAEDISTDDDDETEDTAMDEQE